jgi:signal transduction histidine kinase
MAEMKNKELTSIEELQKQIEETEKKYQKEVQRIVGIANKYIKAYRDLLYQLKTTVETNLTLDEMMIEQSKEK